MAIDQKIIDELEKVVGKDRISTAPAVLYTYGFDSSIYHHDPDVVVQPVTTEEVSEIMKIAYKYEIPVTPRGSGTGLCGAAVPINGGIVVAMQKMNKIKRVSIEDLWVDVEAGCIYNDLNAELAKVAEAHGVGLAQIPVAWAIAKGTRPIVGVTKESHVTDAANASSVALSADEVRELESVADSLGINAVRAWEKKMD